VTTGRPRPTPDYAEATRRIVSLLGTDGSRQLLRLLEQDAETRAKTFAAIHERGRSETLLDAPPTSRQTR
jgi:hypothetical protein